MRNVRRPSPNCRLYNKRQTVRNTIPSTTTAILERVQGGLYFSIAQLHGSANVSKRTNGLCQKNAANQYDKLYRKVPNLGRSGQEYDRTTDTYLHT